MEENKYFTPEISDLRVGYQCEVDYGYFTNAEIGTWYPLVLVGVGQEIIEYCKKGFYRVPYLTKEQIVADGWKPVSSGDCLQWYKDSGNLAIKLYPDLGPTKSKRVIRIWQEMKNGNQLFVGECKCINDLRLIMKMLCIK